MTYKHIIAIIVSFMTFQFAMADTDNSVIETVIKHLQSDDPAQRTLGNNALKMLEACGLTLDEGMMAIPAAAGTFPANDFDSRSVQARLIHAAAKNAKMQYIKPIVSIFKDLPPDAKAEAFTLLARVDTDESMKAMVDMLKVYGTDLKDHLNLFSILRDSKLPLENITPVLIEMLRHQYTESSAAGLILKYAEKNRLSKDFWADHLVDISASYRVHLAKFKNLYETNKADKTGNYRWTDEYRYDLCAAEYYPDFLGKAGKSAAPILYETFAAHDPRLSFFAAESLLRLGLSVPQDTVMEIARDDEMRNNWFESLEKLHKSELFPREFKTQEAFARSAMVSWLVYPTELGRAPNEIELMKIVERKLKQDDETLVLYVFRFRTTGQHWAAKNGWMAGVAGGYRKSEMPTTRSLGQTFSKFASYDSATPEEHAGIITSLIEEWSDNAKRQKKSEK